MSKKSIFLLILAISWMGLIFYMSNVNGEDSGNKSSDIVTFIIDKYDKITKASNEKIEYHHSMEFMDKANYYFRKICHFSEYLILEIILLCLLISFNKYPLLRLSMYSFSISVIYSLLDEYHQTFIVGRSGQVIDILIDALGTTVGWLFVIFIYKFSKKNRKKYNFTCNY